MLTFSRTIPKGEHQPCPDHQQRAEGFIHIQLAGGGYWIPLTHEMKVMFDITRQDDRISCRRRHGDEYIERIIMDIAWAVYLQMRDVVGAEIEKSLSEQLNNGFAKLFEQHIGRSVRLRVKQRFPKKQSAITYSKEGQEQ